MATPSFNIAQDAAATFAAGAWLSDKSDDPNGPTVAEADVATACGSVWANGVDEALVQTNEVFQGTRVIDSLSIGTGTDATARLAFAKTDAGDQDFAAFYAGTNGTAANLRWAWRFASDEDLSIRRYTSGGVFVDTVFAIDWATGGTTITTGTTGTLAVTTNGGTTTFLASGGVQRPVSGGYRSNTNNAAYTIAATDLNVELSTTAASTVAATMTATYAGHALRVVLTVRTAGAYTFACTRGATAGTVTLDAVGEGCLLVYSGTTWKLFELLGGATFA